MTAMTMEYCEAVGRRKAATARVRLFSGGTGSIIINERPLETYFAREVDRLHLKGPLEATAMEDRFNVSVKVKGGGMRGQAGAVRLGIARALLKVDPDLRPILRKGGFLTRDARIKERKKPGLKRARKRPTFTKR